MKFTNPARSCKETDLFQMLDLDSDIFGFPVARILPERLAENELQHVISLLKAKRVRLAYWASDPKHLESQRAAELCRGFLADEKVTFSFDLTTVPSPPRGEDAYTGSHIEEYAGESPTPEMENLAFQIGMNSRFGADPRIPEDKLKAMYRRWIRNSVNGQVADAVLVARRSGKVVGMATVGAGNGRGYIGLFAVDAAMRGKNLSVLLVREAQAWARRKGSGLTRVVTQGKNIPACRLYEKCGYKIEKIEFFYHFWI